MVILMKRFITLFILAAVVFMIPDMAGAFEIKVLGTGNNSYYVYDSEREQIGDAQTIIDEDEEDGVEISDEGTYTVELSDVSREITVEDDVTLVSGSVLVFGWGTDPYDLYDEDDNKLGGAETGEYTDMFAGSYTVRLNDTSQPATVVSGARTFLGAGAILVRGTGTDRYDVYDADENKLGGNDTEGDVELFPGTYTVELNKTRETTVIVEAFRRSVLKAGAIKITGTGSDSYNVCDLDENDLGSDDEIGRAAAQFRWRILGILFQAKCRSTSGSL